MSTLVAVSAHSKHIVLLQYLIVSHVVNHIYLCLLGIVLQMYTLISYQYVNWLQGEQKHRIAYVFTQMHSLKVVFLYKSFVNATNYWH